jgi:hypothetical protein
MEKEARGKHKKKNIKAVIK